MAWLLLFSLHNVMGPQFGIDHLSFTNETDCKAALVQIRQSAAPSMVNGICIQMKGVNVCQKE